MYSNNQVRFTKPEFPTSLHREAAETVSNYFLRCKITDTVLIVNSCARGKAVAESDLDIAVLVKENIDETEISTLYNQWLEYCNANKLIQRYKKLNAFTHLHLDIINGVYKANSIEANEPVSYFEVEIGNQICYASPMSNMGAYYKKLQEKWLPYYDEELRLERFKQIQNACSYDLIRIPYLLKRDLHFHAFDIFYKALQKYLQALFIANKTYPLAYNKWIKYQLTNLLGKPELYHSLTSIFSIKNINSNELSKKAKTLNTLLNNL